jgi:4-hydroxy-2-oxoglutarate aldolase
MQRAAEAAERGADAVLVVAPHYYGSAMTTTALREHYSRVADASPVPVMLYNIPRYMHFALDAALVAELAAHENIVGIKDSSGDEALLDGYLAAQSASFSVLTGSGAGLYAALGRGARGGILAVALFALDETTGGNSAALLYQAWRAGRREAAARYQERLTPLSREIVAGMGVPGVKAALDEVGLAGGPPRLPLLPLDARERERLTGLLQSAATPA